MVRIGIVYDGSYFARISDHYAYHHPRRARIHIQGLHEFIRHKAAECEQVETNICRIVEAHYFRGRFPSDVAERRNSLANDRKFEDVLIRAGVTPHFLLLDMSDGEMAPREKGIDVWLALEAYELASVKGCDMIVLITGDGDHVQLVRKLNSLGTRVVVLAWDLNATAGTRPTRTSQALMDAATYSIEMATLIDGRGRDPMIDRMFMPTIQKQDTIPYNQPEPRFWSSGGQEFGAVEYGIVINVLPGRDYGFIQPDNGGENIHYHFSAVNDDDPDLMEEGTRVSFVRTVNPNSGKLTARNVTPQDD